MRMLMNVTIPHEPFNAAVRDGTAGAKINKILEHLTPEAVYFTEQNGKRGAILIVNLPNDAKVPALAEPSSKSSTNCFSRSQRAWSFLISTSRWPTSVLKLAAISCLFIMRCCRTIAGGCFNFCNPLNQLGPQTQAQRARDD